MTIDISVIKFYFIKSQLLLCLVELSFGYVQLCMKILAMPLPGKLISFLLLKGAPPGAVTSMALVLPSLPCVMSNSTASPTVRLRKSSTNWCRRIMERRSIKRRRFLQRSYD
ncbi:unnamed protein product [Microthlaspi erraticum]|uniref:Uncharacterized protein n=1 Tax=Microthlaspi erraticum TaxID=1685480 RepID=A0A6D2JX10_9BRAS|nr:unnamed protein product [Microthlaspi erraticum]